MVAHLAKFKEIELENITRDELLRDANTKQKGPRN